MSDGCCSIGATFWSRLFPTLTMMLWWVTGTVHDFAPALHFGEGDNEEDAPIAIGIGNGVFPWSKCFGCHCIRGSVNDLCPPQPKIDYDDAFLERLAHQQASNHWPALTCNPFVDKDCRMPITSANDMRIAGTSAERDATVCARIYTPIADGGGCSDTFKMQTFANRSIAEAQEGVVVLTHLGGPCGLCSTTQDLSAHIRHALTWTTVRHYCGPRVMWDVVDGIDCFAEQLDLTRPCATLVAYATRHAAQACFWPCLVQDGWRQPPNGVPPTCSLESCQQCEQDVVGRVFETWAGLTSPRAGLLSTVAYPCSSLSQIQHTACPWPS